MAQALSENPNRRPPGSAHADSRCKTILVVDDQNDVRASFTRVLERAGHTVLEAENGAEAQQVAAAHDGPIDLLITDVYIPGLRGPEIAEHLRPTHPSLRVLYTSGYGVEDIARSGVFPTDGFLAKPFTIQELNDAVAKVMGDQK